MSRRVRMLALMSLPAVLFIAVPLAGLFSKTALDQVCPLLTCHQVTSALRLTAVTSGLAAVLIVLMGTPLAYSLAHGRFKGKRAVDTIVDLPLVLPPAVAGVALVFTFGRTGMVGRFLAPHFTIPFTPVAVVMAQVFVSAPLYIRQARAAFLGVPPQLAHASRTLGASPTRTFLRVTAPLASHGLVAGLVLAWARAVGEFGATLLFAGNMEGVTQTMSLAIFTNFEARQQLTSVIVMSGILVALSFLVIIATKALLESRQVAEDAAGILG